jgi:hypothetical protein
VAVLRTLRRIAASPDEATLALRMAAWTPVLPVLKRVLPLPRLVGLMAPRGRSLERDLRREERIAAIARRLYRTRPITHRDNCLERSLVAYRFLSRAGAEPMLVVGFRREVKDIHGHVWVTVDDVPVHDAPAELAAYETVTAFGSDGRVVSARGPAGPLPRAQGGTQPPS